MEIGLKALLRRVEDNCLNYSAEAVCDLVDESMANNWKGIIFDRLKESPKPVKNTSYVDSIQNRVKDVDMW